MTTLPLDSLPEHFRPLRRHEFEQLVELGVYEGTHVELVGGVLVEMTPQGPLHNAVIRRLTGILVRAVGEAYEVGVQVPLVVDDISLPEPDFVVVPAGRFVEVHPDTALLVVEVAFSSQRFDLVEKARRYGAAGVAEYWVIDLVGAAVHVHREPSPLGWGQVEVVTDGSLTALHLSDVAVEVATLLPGGAGTDSGEHAAGR